MNRRRFLAGAAAAGALGKAAFAQGRPATAAPQGRGQPGAGGRGLGTPANVPAAKLARVSLMTLNFGSMLKLPWTQNPNGYQTLSVLDLPQMYRDVYGVSHIEFQHNHLVDTAGSPQQPPDPDFFRQVRAKLDAAQVTATQVNIEIGTIPNLSGDARDKWMTAAKQWVDAAPIIGVKRLMLNQTGLNEENKANCISVWREIQDYAKPKGIRISAETRGTGGGRRGGAAADAAQPQPDQRAVARAAYTLLANVIEAAGAYSNVDIGNVGAPDQETLHDAIKTLYPTSSGNMHIKSSPNWDIGAAVRFTESLGFRGHYSIEVNGHPAVRQVYDLILANVTNPLAE
jgi:sugar phosphate isomerase/epimerase